MNRNAMTSPHRTAPTGKSVIICRAPRAMRRMQGLSIVELMVAITISVLIMMALVRVFVSNRITYQADEGLARLQENARFAVEFLARDIRAAGNTSCMRLKDDPTSLQNKDINQNQKILMYLAGGTVPGWDHPLFNIAVPVLGWDATAVTYGAPYTLPTMYPPATTATTTPPIGSPYAPPTALVQGSDLIMLRSMDEGGVTLVSPFHDNTSVYVSRPNNINTGDILMLTDCNYAAVFQATTVTFGGANPYDTIAHVASGNPGNICSTWGSAQCPRANRLGFKEGSHFATMRSVLYFVGPGQYGGPSLFRRNFNTGIDEELVEGIENLQFLYGLNLDGDTSGAVDTYLPASAIAQSTDPALDQWRLVQTVRISMLVATSNVRGGADTPFDTDTYTVQDSIMTPNADNRRRRVFDATVEIRNRL